MSQTHPLFYVIASVCLWTQIGFAQDRPDESLPPVEPVVTPAVDEQPEKADETHSVSRVNLERRKKATAGLAVVGVIGFLGLGAMVVIMLWSQHLRRLARDLGPRQTTAGNDFWFLKPPKTIASEGPLTELPGATDVSPPSDTTEPPA